jgi:6-phosphogluconolactonase
MKTVGVTLFAAVLAVVVFALAGASATPVSPHAGSTGAVFVMTNSPSGNQVLAYERSPSGQLTWIETVPAHGNGTGASLADQGSLAATHDHEWLLAVDAGSNQVSVFRVDLSSPSQLLTFRDVVSSGGIEPVSIAIHRPFVYVLNAGSAISQGNIAGFRLLAGGQLVPLPGSTQPLSQTGATGPAQISFNPAGTVLVVTEKATSLLDAYTVNAQGVASGPITHSSNGNTPYGFAFDPQGVLIVSEAGPGALSSYSVSSMGGIDSISHSVSDLQTAPCWVVATGNDRFAYTSNADSDSISSYVIGTSGSLTLLQSVAAATNAGPTDLALTSYGGFLYVYDSGAHDLQGFHVNGDGTLVWVVSAGSLPAGAEGLVAI